MKEITNVTLYACSFCGRKFQRKHFAIYHEAYKCVKNPNNHHKCFAGYGCKNLNREDCTIEPKYGAGYTVGVNFYCALHEEKEMFTFKQNKRRRFFVENISKDAIRMPTECGDYIENDLPY